MVGLFSALTIAHVILTVLFYVGVHDTGHGFFLDYEWPSWLITIIDASVVLLVLLFRRERLARSRAALGASIVAATLVVGRALWMVFAPALAAVLIVEAIRQVARSRQSA